MKYEYRRRETYNGHKIDIKAHTARELKEKYLKKIKEIDAQLVTSSITVDRWADVYFDNYVRERVSDRTYHDRVRMYNARIKPYIGAMKVSSVTPLILQDIENKMSSNAKNTISKTHQLLFNIFEAARRERLILSNPALDILPPKGKEEQHRRALTINELALLTLPHRATMWIRIMMYCGLRPGETDRLRWEHLNLEDDYIFIDGTKTKSAKRIVPLPDFLSEELKQMKPPYNDFVFLNTQGYQLRKSSRAKMWSSLLSDLAEKGFVLPPDVVPYCLRHTFATDLLNAGLSFNARQALLGHAGTSVTDRYTHLSLQQLERAKEQLNPYWQEKEDEIKNTQDFILTYNELPSDNNETDVLDYLFPNVSRDVSHIFGKKP